MTVDEGSGGLELEGSEETPQAGESMTAEETAALSSTPVTPHGAGAVILSSSEIRQFAGELAAQLFDRWESALQEQFQAELGVRLEAELKHREHEARQLRDEVKDRRAIWEGQWSPKHPRGLSNDYSRWEMEQTMRRQASALAETERQMMELQARLRELGYAPDGVTVTVDAQGEIPEPGEPAE